MVSDNSPVILQELVRRSNEDARRLRSLEQRLDALETRINSAESANIERAKKINAKFAEVDVTMRNLSDEITKLVNNFDKVNRQIGKFARKQDLKEIEHMLELISPIRQEFVTKDDLREEVEEEVKREIRVK